MGRQSCTLSIRHAAVASRKDGMLSVVLSFAAHLMFTPLSCTSADRKAQRSRIVPPASRKRRLMCCNSVLLADTDQSHAWTTGSQVRVGACLRLELCPEVQRDVQLCSEW